ncbi:ferrochelatase [Meiothermus hypogaeus]|uniref:Ferrochelatase n=2 Tax=Meiothermus hypogaeus TaxID=884155 RepID=A0A511QZW6_9DEIN|nr:ferrochelatase [Meiothermus hypogaeus]RIH77083.1 Ferrochelatase [Meiothermus hypogaeus]GEM82898.1 ferrochelatase [Meiothermus hypogaeus NBRC 106114]GIW37062.1 MAG: ferrochelatase [Meiothermus sp.]
MNVLLMAYGTPYRPEEIEPYYTDIRRGRPPSPELLDELAERYNLIGRSPLSEITYAQAVRLEAALNATLPLYSKPFQSSPGPRVQGPARVYLGTKHWHPFIAEAVQAMAQDGVRQAVGIVAAPHFSSRSIAEYREKVEHALAELGHPFTFSLVEAYPDHPGYIQAVSGRVGEQIWRLREPGRALFLFTAHSIPEKSAQDGIYQAQVRTTAERVAESLGLAHWDVAWQSAGRTPEPWIGPDINERLEAAAAQGYGEVVVTAVGFPSDHLEVFYDLDYEAQNTATRLGLRLLRTRSLNADPDYIEVLRDLVLSAWARLPQAQVV